MGSLVCNHQTHEAFQVEGALSQVLQSSPAWLCTLREHSWSIHCKLGIPTLKDEEWKYTSLRSLLNQKFSGIVKQILTQEQLKNYVIPGLNPHLIVVENGILNKSLSHNFSESGLKILNLEEALSQHSDLLQQHLGQLTKPQEFTFGALNQALFQDVVVVHVAKNAQIESPVHLLNVTTQEQGLCCPRILLIVEEGAQVQLIESYHSLHPTAHFTNIVFEGWIHSNAQVEHIKIQQENIQSFHIGLYNVDQKQDSNYTSVNITFGGAITRNDINAYLDGSNIHTTLDGAYVINGTQLSDNHTRIDHAKPHCYSWEVYKGILDEQAQGVFNGKIFVHQDAQKTDAKQTNQAMLLSDKAVVNTKPQLEIFADDVRCTHGATIGQLNKEPLFYLQSRGIPKDQARAMLVHAFANEVFETITIESIREYLEKALYAKLLNLANS